MVPLEERFIPERGQLEQSFEQEELEVGTSTATSGQRLTRATGSWTPVGSYRLGFKRACPKRISEYRVRSKVLALGLQISRVRVWSMVVLEKETKMQLCPFM